jgi:hypothetical protein
LAGSAVVVEWAIGRRCRSRLRIVSVTNPRFGFWFPFQGPTAWRQLG